MALGAGKSLRARRRVHTVVGPMCSLPIPLETSGLRTMDRSSRLEMCSRSGVAGDQQTSRSVGPV